MVKMDPLTRWVCPKPIGKAHGVFPLVEAGWQLGKLTKN